MNAVYGCHNREPLSTWRMVQDGWRPIVDGALARHERTIADPMSKDCRYTHSQEGLVDPKCAGCKHKAELAA